MDLSPIDMRLIPLFHPLISSPTLNWYGSSQLESNSTPCLGPPWKKPLYRTVTFSFFFGYVFPEIHNQITQCHVLDEHTNNHRQQIDPTPSPFVKTTISSPLLNGFISADFDSASGAGCAMMCLTNQK